MICVTEAYSNRYPNSTCVKIHLRNVEHRGPEWERRYDRDYFHTYVNTMDEAKAIIERAGG